jgi:S-adenosylmethionine:tRNA ribosyltransferase-isomerase
MLVSEFDYELPPGLVAQHPAARRDASRLLHVDAKGRLRDLKFSDLPSLVGPEDAVVLNDTRVIKARLAARKASGGKVELFVERLLDARHALALIRASHPPSPGTVILISEGISVKVEGRMEDLYRVRFSHDVEGVLERHGAVPAALSRHAAGKGDAELPDGLRVERAPWRRRPRACISTGRCWRISARAARSRLP